MEQAPGIDTILLGCTHYPLLADKIQQYLPAQVRVLSQGTIVAESLKDYLHRHPEMEQLCSKNGTRRFLTTDDTTNFDEHASIFFGSELRSEHCSIPHVS